MNAQSLAARVAPALFAAILALGASVALAQEKPDTGDGAPTLREQGCLLVGCNNGSRVCGSIEWSEWIWIPTPWVPIPWRFTQTATCYETQAF